MQFFDYLKDITFFGYVVLVLGIVTVILILVKTGVGEVMCLLFLHLLKSVSKKVDNKIRNRAYNIVFNKIKMELNNKREEMQDDANIELENKLNDLNKKYEKSENISSFAREVANKDFYSNIKDYESNGRYVIEVLNISIVDVDAEKQLLK